MHTKIAKFHKDRTNNKKKLFFKSETVPLSKYELCQRYLNAYLNNTVKRPYIIITIIWKY